MRRVPTLIVVVVGGILLMAFALDRLAGGSDELDFDGPPRTPAGYSVVEHERFRLAYPDAWRDSSRPDVEEQVQLVGPRAPSGALPSVLATALEDFDRGLDALIADSEAFDDASSDDFVLLREDDVELAGATAARVVVSESTTETETGETSRSTETNLYAVTEEGGAVLLTVIVPASASDTVDAAAVLESFRLADR